VIDMTRVYDAFITSQAIPNGEFLFYAKLDDARSVIRLALFACQLFTLDVFLVS
jgi:hypothetical protein